MDRGSKKAGEKIVKIDNGYIIKDASNATVGIATVIEPRGTGAGDQFQQQNEVANPTESMFPTLTIFFIFNYLHFQKHQ